MRTRDGDKLRFGTEPGGVAKRFVVARFAAKGGDVGAFDFPRRKSSSGTASFACATLTAFAPEIILFARSSSSAT